QPELGLTCVAPPPVRSLSVTVPAATLSSSVAFPWRSHTLASNVSTHVGPTFTESGGQVVNGPTPGGPCGPVDPCGPAGPAAPCGQFVYSRSLVISGQREVSQVRFPTRSDASSRLPSGRRMRRTVATPVHQVRRQMRGRT